MSLVTHLKPKHKISRYEKIRFSLKIKIGGRKKLRRTQNSKSGQKQWFYFFGLIFFVVVKNHQKSMFEFRVSFSFTLLQKRFLFCRFLEDMLKTCPVVKTTRIFNWSHPFYGARISEGLWYFNFTGSHISVPSTKQMFLKGLYEVLQRGEC